MPPPRIPFLNLNAAFQATEAEVRAALDRVLTRGWYILGEEGTAFEKEFAAYLGIPHAVGVASGTDALALALHALDIGPGDEVITVPNTCVPTVAAIVAAGATPVFVDVESDTLTIDSDALSSALTDRTRAIMPVHLYGRPCAMDAIMTFSNEHGLKVVEDCAQAHGTSYQGNTCGTFGDAAAFSFYPTKNLGALGDAGMVVTKNEAVAERVRRLRNYGLERRDWCAESGRNSRLDELQAAVLRARLPHLNAMNDRRRSLANRYTGALSDLPIRLPLESLGSQPSWHLYVIRTPARDGLRTHLLEHGIGSEIHYRYPIHLQPGYQHLAQGPGAFPVAERASEEILSLPLHPQLTEADQDAVLDAIVTFFG